MRLALREAEKGQGRTSPNPAVGAVLVQGGKVIGRGHHARAGAPHAEVMALRDAGARAAGADLYTTLEPCDHFGKTPPCSRAILDAGVRRVFVGSRDPNPVVKGRGVARLRRAGVEVVQGVLREACDALNAPWFRFITAGRPFVTLKVAATLDGKIATRTGDSRWVTGPEARLRVHQLRDQVDAVLVGAGTARQDDPALTSRLPSGAGRDPIRVVLDADLRLPTKLGLFHSKSPAPTWVAHLAEPRRTVRRRPRLGPGVELLPCRGRKGRIDLGDLLTKLAGRGVTHLLVEGGAQVFGSFLSRQLADRVLVFVAPKIVGGDGLSWAGGAGALGVRTMDQAISLREPSVERLGDDWLVTGIPAYPLAKNAGEG